MTPEATALAASVVFAGLWSGLLGMLTLVMHKMLGSMEGGDFERFLRVFLPVARRAWFNYACALGMAIAPACALVLLWDERNSAPFVLTAIGLAIVVVGVYVVSNVWKEPLYDEMLTWAPEPMPIGWETRRRRYFVINWIQALATWMAFALFLASLIAVQTEHCARTPLLSGRSPSLTAPALNASRCSRDIERSDTVLDAEGRCSLFNSLPLNEMRTQDANRNGVCHNLRPAARKLLILNGEMSEWLKEHAWKSIWR